jgi:hypothetical protein
VVSLRLSAPRTGYWMRNGTVHSNTAVALFWGYLTFYHYNGWHLSVYHFNSAKYIFTLDVVKAIHFYHFCSRGAPA